MKAPGDFPQCAARRWNARGQLPRCRRRAAQGSRYCARCASDVAHRLTHQVERGRVLSHPACAICAGGAR